jgi:hypothetical protein
MDQTHQLSFLFFSEVCKADVKNVANCQYWKGLGYCQHTHVKYMEDNCCKTCGKEIEPFLP